MNNKHMIIRAQIDNINADKIERVYNHGELLCVLITKGERTIRWSRDTFDDKRGVMRTAWSANDESGSMFFADDGSFVNSATIERYYKDLYDDEKDLRLAESGYYQEMYEHGRAVMSESPYEAMREELALQDFEERLRNVPDAPQWTRTYDADDGFGSDLPF